ncbi:MAG: hypothetical protein ACRD3G_17720 [Vicinamibacterales bacterium]
MPKAACLVLLCFLASTATLDAQRGRGGGAAAPAASPQKAAPIDLTGYWVSPIIEDWKFRMVIPNKGVFGGVPLNAQGQKVGNAWDPVADEKAGEQCRAFGAAGIMRLPSRLNITWQDEATLRVDIDTGTQTRIFSFRGAPAPAEPSWQGQSAAQWNVPGRSLKVVTTNLKPGYVRRNGAPYSNRAVVTEYWELHTLPNKDQWLTVTTKVDDPVYFSRPYLTSSDFKKLPGAAGWNPTPCAAK